MTIKKERHNVMIDKTEPIYATKVTPIKRQPPSWEEELIRTDKGAIRATNGNLRAFVRSLIKPKLNVFANKLYGSDGELLRDRDGAKFAADLSDHYGVEFNNNRVLDAMIHFADEFNPALDYVNGLRGKWDGVKRVETMLIDWLLAEDTPYTRHATKQFLKSLIKRIYIPGCELQEVPVFVGAQGCYKSNLLRDLCQGIEDAFMDSLRSTDSKVVGEETAGVVLVEMPELKLLDGLKEEAKKEFISRRHEKYRPAFGRLAEIFKRQFVLVGTHNKREFLGDITGDRRWVPIQCGRKEDILAKKPWENFRPLVDQILAEAVVLYNEDPFVGIPTEMIKVYDEVREGFRYDNPYMEQFATVLERTSYPQLISIEWLAREIGWSCDPDRKIKAAMHDAIRRIGGYEQIFGVKKVNGKPTRNAYEKK